MAMQQQLDSRGGWWTLGQGVGQERWGKERAATTTTTTAKIKIYNNFLSDGPSTANYWNAFAFRIHPVRSAETLGPITHLPFPPPLPLAIFPDRESPHPHPHPHPYPFPHAPFQRSNERKHNFPMFCTNSLFDRKILFLHSNRSAKQKCKKAKKNGGKKSKMPLQFCLCLTLPFGLLLFFFPPLMRSGQEVSCQEGIRIDVV